jgi:hypothetical protein
MFVGHIVLVARELWRVLRMDACFMLNLGDSYAGNRGNTSEKPGYDNKAAGNNGANLAIGHKRAAAQARCRLRPDLTPEQRAYVLAELAKADAISEDIQEGLE